MIIKHGRYIFGEISEMRKGLWAFFLGCAFRVLIGLEGKLQSGDSSGGIRGLIMSSLLTRMESNLILKIVVGKRKSLRRADVL